MAIATVVRRASCSSGAPQCITFLWRSPSMRYSKAISSVVAIASVALAGACSRTISSTTAAGSLSPALSTNPAITSADVAMLASMSPSERLTHLAVGDSMEIAMAQVALQRSQNAAIQSFAQRMITDHTQSLQRGHLIAQQEGLALTPAASDT